MAVSITLVHRKFLVQQSFSLTLWPLRPTLSKVNKTYEQHRHSNALVIVLLIGKIPTMKQLLSYTLCRQDLRRLRKYYRLEVKPAYFSQICSLLLFLHSQLVLHSFESHFFSRIRIHLVIFIRSCTSRWQDLKGLIKYYLLEVQLAHLVDFAQFLLQFAFNFTFLNFTQSYTTLESLFYEYILVSWSCTCNRQDLRWLRKYYGLAVLSAFKVNLAHFTYFLIYGKTFLHSTLVSYCCGISPQVYFLMLFTLVSWLVGS